MRKRWHEHRTACNLSRLATDAERG